MAPRLAFIGLGNMGRGMCKNLVEKGKLDEPLVLYNRTKTRTDDLHATLPPGKTTVASSIEETVKPADIIFTCVANDKSIMETIDEALLGDVKGKLFCECSTIHPDTTRALEKKVLAKGAEFVAMPIFGAPAMAESGQLLCVPAGPASAVNKIKPYTDGVMGRATIDLSGEEVGKAPLLKIVGNTVILGMVEHLAEGHTLADKSGLGSDNFHKFIEQMFPGPYTAYSKRMLTGDYYTREEPLFAVDLARKDVGHALALASSSGTRMESVEVADSHLKIVQEVMGEKGDLPGIYGAVRKLSGLEYGNQEK